jgi:hypothetical protein
VLFFALPRARGSARPFSSEHRYVDNRTHYSGYGTTATVEQFVVVHDREIELGRGVHCHLDFLGETSRRRPFFRIAIGGFPGQPKRTETHRV